MGIIQNYENAEDIKNRIRELVKSYTPEWHFTESDPDAGSVIAMLFAMQTEENLRLAERIPERYRLEFVNMLDISLKAAQPAAGVVLFTPTDSSIPGTMLLRGSRLSAASDQVESGLVVFETDRDIYVTTAAITDAFLSDGDRGVITPLLGVFEDPPVFPGYEEEENQSEEVGEETPHVIRPFTLFGEETTIGKSALLLWHERYFDDTGEPIFIRFKGAEKLVSGIVSGKYSFRYAAENGVRSFSKVDLLEDKETFVLIKDKKCRRYQADDEETGKTLAAIGIVSDKPLAEPVEAQDILLSAGGGEKIPEAVSDGISDLDANGFAPFSDTLAVYNECYIGADSCFSRAGAKITVTMQVKYRENMIRILAETRDDTLKVIKIKPRREFVETTARASVDEISLEYFNGIGWKKLKCDSEVSGLFEGQSAGELKFSFNCPSDWQPAESGSYRGRSLKMRLVRSDNCYLRPALHTYPFISRMRINYSYEGRFQRPDRITRISGTDTEDITAYPATGKVFNALKGFGGDEDVLWLGFDRRLKDGPVSIYFQMSDLSNQIGVHCRFEYSSPNGFKEMRVMDYTDGFTKPGIVMFLPPSDMAMHTVQHKSRYWIRIVRSLNDRTPEVFLPRITSLRLNAVPVTNVQTEDELDYYIDDVEAGMNFALGGDHILDTRVWVNEKNTLSAYQMQELTDEFPERVRAEYDIIGRISAFYVLWSETESFESAPDRRCYRIDRMTNRIHFSDGILCEIPRVTDDVAFKVSIRTTDGALGNLPADSITEILGQAPYIDRVTNPLRTHGGGNLETVEHALYRGARLMHSRERLVSADDYLGFVMEYSDGIESARVIVGKTIDGEGKPSDLSIVLLMKDYANGSFSFHRVEAGLLKSIREKCELTIGPDDIHIVEPIFVSISVNVWIQVMDMDESFEVQSDVRQALNEYLEPVADELHDGWPIGTLPKPSQIMMRLGVLKSRAIVKRLDMIASWRDVNGNHEKDVAKLSVSPFMVCKNGTHGVSVLQK